MSLLVGVCVSIGILVLLIVLAVVARVCVARTLGAAVKEGIELYDDYYVGVSVTIGELVVSPFTGALSIRDLLIKNPPGYSEPHLLKAKLAQIDLSMLTIIRSRMKHIVISRLRLHDIDMIFEEKGKTSNVQEVIRHVQGNHPSQRSKKHERQCVPCCGARDKEDTRPLLANGSEIRSKPKPAEQDQIKVTLHLVSLIDISLKVTATMLEGYGDYISVADQTFQDFDKEIGISVVIELIVRSMIKSVLAEVLGDKYAEAIM